MRTPLRLPMSCALALAAVIGSAATSGCAPPAPVQPKPRVAIAIVIDQLAGWVAEARLEKLPPGGGFARLRSEGTWVKRCEYEYAVTETGPGHAALFTGKTPRETGIVGNRVWRGDLGRAASILEDKETRLVSFDLQQGPEARVFGISLGKLKTDTIADELMRRPGGANIISVSMKDRGAAFGWGRRGQRQSGAILWFDEDTGRLVTSSAFADALPAWAEPFRSTPPSWLWELTPAEGAFLRDRTKAREATADVQDGEAVDLGGITFPHLTKNPITYRATPDADRLLVDLALAAIEHRATAPTTRASAGVARRWCRCPCRPTTTSGTCSVPIRGRRGTSCYALMPS